MRARATLGFFPLSFNHGGKKGKSVRPLMVVVVAFFMTTELTSYKPLNPPQMNMFLFASSVTSY